MYLNKLNTPYHRPLALTEALAAKALAEFSRVDILINNAAIDRG